MSTAVSCPRTEGLSSRLSRRTVLVGGLAWAGSALAGGVVAPVDRPAVVLRHPGQAPLMGLARAGDRLVAVGERGAVLLSDDAGVTWRQARQVPVSVTLTGVQFVSPSVGWATGHQGVVLNTSDGGEHWVRQLEGRQAAALMLTEARAAADDKAITEAERLVAEGADKPLLDLSFVNEREGLVVGAFNLALKTSDGGKTWRSISTHLPNPRGAHLYAVARDGQQVLVAGEQGVVLHSPDGGAHFERLSTPYAGSFFNVCVEASGAWLLAGLRGQVWRSLDAGRTWNSVASPAPVSVTASLRDAQGHVWLMNQAGQILRPQGDRLEVVAPTPAQQPSALVRLPDGVWLIAGWNGITRLAAATQTVKR